MEIDPGKLFIGGISWDTTEQRLRDYFQSYGEVVEALIMKDRITGRGRGFGFIVFASTFVADKVLMEKHFIDGRAVEAKRAVPRDDRQNSNKNNVSSIQESPSLARTKKIFVGGLASTVTDTDFRKYFDQFGKVTDAVVMYDHSTQRPRGFGFITFDSEEAANKVLTKTFHDLSGKMVEVKVAVPKESSPVTAHGLTGSHNYSLNRLGSFLNAHTQGHISSSAGGSVMRLDERFSPVSVARSGYPPQSPSEYTIGLKLNPGYILNYGAVGDSGLDYINGTGSSFSRSPDRHHIRNKFDARGSGLLGDGTLAYGTTASKNFGSPGNGTAGIGGNFGLIKDIWDTSLVSPKVPGNDSMRNGNLSYETWEYHNESFTTSNLSHFASGDLFFKDWPSSSFEPTGSTSFTYGRGSRGIHVAPIKSAGYSGFSNVSTRPDRGNQCASLALASFSHCYASHVLSAHGKKV